MLAFMQPGSWTLPGWSCVPWAPKSSELADCQLVCVQSASPGWVWALQVQAGATGSCCPTGGSNKPPSRDPRTEGLINP